MQKSICLAWTRVSEPGSLYDDLMAPAISEAGRAPLDLRGTSPGLDVLLLSESMLVATDRLPPDLARAIGLREARGLGTVLLVPESVGRDELGDGIAPLAVYYAVTADGTIANRDEARQRIVEKLNARPANAALRVADALERPPIPPVEHGVTDGFRERVDYSRVWRERLSDARDRGDLAALELAQRELDPVTDEAAVWVDLLLSFRALSAWREMVALVRVMPPMVGESTLVREQLAFALNRVGQWREAVDVLEGVIARRGPSSETHSLLGRVYKDRWAAAADSGDSREARQWLDRATAAYLEGFEADWRDPYPGINAATLMEVRQPPDARRDRILPVVLFAAERSLRSGRADYWSHATIVEAAVLLRDPERARQAASDALAAVRESWEPETTARNLRLIREAREKRGEDLTWARAIESDLEARASKR